MFAYVWQVILILSTEALPVSLNSEGQQCWLPRPCDPCGDRAVGLELLAMHSTSPGPGNTQPSMGPVPAPTLVDM